MSEEEAGNLPTEADKKKAQVFFNQARTVGAAGQFEYSIEMYLNGLKFDPQNLDAHQALRDISLKRKVAGGKDMGMLAKMKLRYGKDPRENMLTAEKFLAYDPGNTGRMLEMLQHAANGDYSDVVMWIGPILRRANADSGKPEMSKYLALKDAYIRQRQWRQATDAAQAALALKPDDMDLQRELKDLAAQQTMKEGGYSEGGSFKDSVKNMDEQQALMREDTDARTMDVLQLQIKAARTELEREPNEPGKIAKLVDALVKTEQAEYENEAMEVLEAAFRRSKQFRFRLRVGIIKMQQLKRVERSLAAQVAAHPNDAELKKQYIDFRREKLEEEYKEFALAAENYPTDITYKYEMARRMFQLGNYLESIPLLQQSIQDPKLRVDASIDLGRAFLEADYVDEAVDTMKGLVESYQIQGDAKSKDIYYYYARALEKRGDAPDAIKAYSRVAQWDFNFRDVQTRIKALRQKAAST